MEKKLYVPKVTKYTPIVDGKVQKISQLEINCKWCNKPLTDAQKYEFLRGKSKGTCSASCGNNYKIYKTKENKIKHTSKICEVCGRQFNRDGVKHYKVCSTKCAGILASRRMKNNNPMKNKKTRAKVSKTLKNNNHRPKIQGGNGRGLTTQQLRLFNKLTEKDNSFVTEYIEVTTKQNRIDFKTPHHYKIDIASEKYKIAIEIDGRSHKSLKVKECDIRKTKVLNLQGWKVLRYTNEEITVHLTDITKNILSMI